MHETQASKQQHPYVLDPGWNRIIEIAWWLQNVQWNKLAFS